MAAETTETQCHAITENGERCKRPAGEDGFCYQHDESDETVEEYDQETTGGDEDAGEATDGQELEAMSDGGAPDEDDDSTTEETSGDGGDEDGGESEAEESEADEDQGDESGGEGDGDGESDEDGGSSSEGTGATAGGNGLSGVREVREAVQSLAPEVIGRELDAVIEVDGRDEGWLAVVEIVERPAVPDSQDILGRYEVDLEGDTVTGYRRVDRYRRSDTDAQEPR